MEELYEELVGNDQVFELRGRKYTKKGLRNLKLLEILLVEYLKKIPGLNLDKVIKESGLKNIDIFSYIALYERNNQDCPIEPEYMNLEFCARALTNGYVDNKNNSEVASENAGGKFYEFYKDEYDRAVSISDMHISYLISDIKDARKHI